MGARPRIPAIICYDRHLWTSRLPRSRRADVRSPSLRNLTNLGTYRAYSEGFKFPMSTGMRDSMESGSCPPPFKGLTSCLSLSSMIAIPRFLASSIHWGMTGVDLFRFFIRILHQAIKSLYYMR